MSIIGIENLSTLQAKALFKFIAARCDGCMVISFDLICMLKAIGNIIVDRRLKVEV